MLTHTQHVESLNPTVALVGGMCSGKDSWAKFLVKQFGFDWQGTSDVTREYIAVHGLGQPTRDLVRNTSSYLRELHGQDYLARTALGRLDPERPRVVSGLYVVPELEFMRSVGAKVINIAGDMDMQFARMATRGREGEIGERAEFDRLMGNDLHSTGTDQRLAEVIAMADVEIDGSVPIGNVAECRRLAVMAFQAVDLPWEL